MLYSNQRDMGTQRGAEVYFFYSKIVSVCIIEIKHYLSFNVVLKLFLAKKHSFLILNSIHFK